MKNLIKPIHILSVLLLVMSHSSNAQNWLLTGNAATAANHYLGTTDSRNLRLATNGSVRMTITSTGNFGIGTTLPNAKFHLTTGSFLISGSSSTVPSSISSTSGNYFYYQPLKGALRFGYKSAGTTVWDTTNMGLYSLAFGNNCQASGINSFCGGDYSYAFGRNSFSLGQNSQSGGSYSFAMGLNSGAAGTYSFASGEYASAAGFHSTSRGYYSSVPASFGTAFGQYLNVNSYNSFVIGRYNVASGTTNSWNSSEPLLVAGNGKGSASTSNALTLLKNGNMTISGSLSQSSDMRLKQNVSPVKGVLQKLTDIQPIYYEFVNKETHPGERQLGFSAQEVEKVFPELVRTDENDFLALNYASMSAVTIQAVKEQQEMISELKKQIEEMKNQLNVIRYSNAGANTSSSAIHPVLVSPNPANETVTIRMAMSDEHNDLQCKLINHRGQLVKELPYHGESLLLDLQDLAPGNYVIMMIRGSEIVGTGSFIRR